MQAEFEQLGTITGKFIDPYDGGCFQNHKELMVLKQLFLNALKRLQKEPKSIQVVVETIMSTPPKPVYKTLDRENHKVFLNTILIFIQKAIDEGKCIYFYGD